MKKYWIASLAALGIWTGAAGADVTLPKVISNGMVLQADMPDPIWGTAAPDEAVTVEINGQKQTATADKDGKWMVKLDAQKAGGPFDLKISGKNELTIKNVLVGEVWHASGQSNMRYPFRSAETYATDSAKADFPKIRYFQMDPYHKDTGSWVVCTPQSSANFSAIAYYFARDLYTHLNVPIGIIDTSVSGALIQTFISPSAIDADPALSAAANTQKDQGISTNFTPMVSQIVPYGIRGVIWYQGEGNRDMPISYQKLFPGLIADWRKLWNEGDFPFLFVQLANFRERKANPWVAGDVGLREAQSKALAVPETAMAVTIEVAKPNRLPGSDGKPAPAPPPGNFDVMNVHYPNKEPVGDRLALAARALAYKEKIEYSGPLFESAKFEGGKAIVSFTHVGSGLMAKGDSLKGFLLAGADKTFVRAEAEIQGDTVVVHSDKVTAPVAVRYAFEENPECNFYNKEGLPAAPFRSDDWTGFGLKDEK